MKIYVGHFLSVAYFRIPEFRKEFLKCILAKNEDLNESFEKEEEESSIS